MPEGVAETSTLNKQPVDTVPKFRPTTSKPTTKASGSSSSLRSAQRTGTHKRKYSPAPRFISYWAKKRGRTETSKELLYEVNSCQYTTGPQEDTRK